MSVRRFGSRVLGAALAAGAIAAAAAVGGAEAGTCGGGAPCQCGDTVTANYTLRGDLGPCRGNGLIVESGVQLDCAGHRIVGSGKSSDKFGIFLNGRPEAPVRRVTVRGCHVSGFLRGIRLRSATASSFIDNVASGNGNPDTHQGYGIDLSGGSYNNVFERNRVEGNADEGIHVGTGSYKNRFVDNVSRNNFREALYLLASDNNVFLRNTFGGGVNSLYLKDSTGNVFEQNTFLDKPVRIIGNSRDNQFVDNTFERATVRISPYRGDASRAPMHNRIIGGSISAVENCLRFTSVRNNLVIDTVLRGCRIMVRGESTNGPSENSVIGTVPSTVELDEGSTLHLGRQVRVEVRDPSGAPVAGAQVQAIDATGKQQFTAVTDDSGVTPPRILVTETRTGARVAERGPVRLEVAKAGYRAETRAISLSEASPLKVVLRPE